MDADMFEACRTTRANGHRPNLRVVVFESANPDFYLAHFEVKDTARTLTLLQTVGRHRPPSLLDTFVRLTKSPVVSIAKIRGRARGVSSEFLLACDHAIRLAREHGPGASGSRLGVHPGGGATERLPPLVGRGRALEIVLGSNDFGRRDRRTIRIRQSGASDKELDGFVDALARRIASFDGAPSQRRKN